MFDRKNVRKKVLLGLLSSPLTLVPLLLGSTLLAGALVLAKYAGVLLFGGSACVLGAAGTFLTRLLLGSEEHTRRAVEEVQREAASEREARLDDLDRRLAEDDDPRTEATLRDLRAFAKALGQHGTWTERLNATSAFDILAGVQDLFETCVQSLETSLQLFETARTLTTPGARAPILQRRDEIVKDVQQSTAKLSGLLVEIQKLGADGDSATDLARIRSELDQNLAVARSVEDKMQAWERRAAEFE